MSVKRQTEAPVFLGRGDIPETLTHKTPIITVLSLAIIT